MPALARTRRCDRPLQGQGTLLSACLQAGLPMASACSGRGACGRCVLTILEGELAVPSKREAALLARIQAGPADRLACQSVLPDPSMDLLVTAGYW